MTQSAVKTEHEVHKHKRNVVDTAGWEEADRQLQARLKASKDRFFKNLYLCRFPNFRRNLPKNPIKAGPQQQASGLPRTPVSSRPVNPVSARTIKTKSPAPSHYAPQSSRVRSKTFLTFLTPKFRARVVINRQ